MAQKGWLAHRYRKGADTLGPAHAIGKLFPYYLALGVLFPLVALAGGWLKLKTAGEVPAPVWWKVAFMVYAAGLFMLIALRIALAAVGRPRIGLFEWTALILQSALWGGVAHACTLPAMFVDQVSLRLPCLVLAQLIYIVGGGFLLHWLASRFGREMVPGRLPRSWISVVLFVPPIVVPPLTGGLFALLIVGPFVGPFLVLVIMVVAMFFALFQKDSLPKPGRAGGSFPHRPRKRLPKRNPHGIR